MKAVKNIKEEMLKDPKVKAEYDRLEPEFRLASMLIETRYKAGLSQEALAERMGMKQASVDRIESGRNNPSMRPCKGMQRPPATSCRSV